MSPHGRSEPPAWQFSRPRVDRTHIDGVKKIAGPKDEGAGDNLGSA